MVNTNLGPRRFAFKKNSGKLSDYWEFVKREGFKIFRITYGKQFDHTDKTDHELMGAIWKAQPQEKRDQYKTYIISMNCSDLVHARRQIDSAKYREANQNMGRHVLNVKRRHKIKQEMEHRERIRQYRPIDENDLSNYMINTETPMFFNEQMFEIKRKKELDKAISSIRFKCTEGDPAYVIRQHTLFLIKVNIYDSVYVSEFHLARIHPSEVSLCVFNLSDGVKRTQSFLVKFEGRMLYKETDRIPPEHYEKVKKMENDGLFPNSDFARSVFEIFSLLYNTWKTEFPTALPVVQSGDWNKTVGSLFLLAHAAEMPHEFQQMFLKLSILDDQLLAMGEIWKRFRGDRTYRELSLETVRTHLQISLQPILNNSRFYCEYHQKMGENQRINCALVRAASCVHNFFSICADANIGDWQSSYISRKSDGNFFFCKELDPELSAVENHVDSVTVALNRGSDSEDDRVVISDEELERVTQTIENMRIFVNNPSPSSTRIHMNFDRMRRSSDFSASPHDISSYRLPNTSASTSQDMPSTSAYRQRGVSSPRTPFTPSEHSRTGVSSPRTSNSQRENWDRLSSPSISMGTISPNNRQFSVFPSYQQRICGPSEWKSSPEPVNVMPPSVSVIRSDGSVHEWMRPSNVTLEFTIMYDDEVREAEITKLKSIFNGKNIAPPLSPSQRLLWSYTLEAKYFRLTNSGH